MFFALEATLCLKSFIYFYLFHFITTRNDWKKYKKIGFSLNGAVLNNARFFFSLVVFLYAENMNLHRKKKNTSNANKFRQQRTLHEPNRSQANSRMLHTNESENVNVEHVVHANVKEKCRRITKRPRRKERLVNHLTQIHSP